MIIALCKEERIMIAILIILAAVVLLALGYVFYGSWLAKEWGIDPSKTTPAVEIDDGVDYVAAKPAVLMGHHFSSIAGAGPINGPIQASVFGWVPVFLWCVIGGIFYWVCHEFLGFNYVWSGIVCAGAVIVMRLLAVRFHLHLPTLKGEE